MKDFSQAGQVVQETFHKERWGYGTIFIRKDRYIKLSIRRGGVMENFSQRQMGAWKTSHL